ncbi:hypothetical protein HYH03_001801 [Edaphochlamys debaryana]|uniref:Uric acid-xanthine permease n=1 Tax=Edaphochlamys debaryana TaxID=47281 RepID=A0A835YCL3_9CHLO|nr:hypothetical protein HYH03_001801 [Edaphochlamys debaryana]|eukprot:KAG2500223.1 hypothetical protein HYH03_001801 [Edaphochlamys debaryana]
MTVVDAMEPPPMRRTFKEMMLGTYDFKYLCMPVFPYCNKRKGVAPPRFFGTYEFLGLVVALVMGLQHALAMVGDLVQASLIVCGIMTFFQVLGARIRGTPYQFGAGILSCMGVSFTTVPIATSVISVLMKEQGHTFEQAYGIFLGTVAACAVIPVFLSFIPIRIIKKVFPPIVCGVTIMLIGVHLIGAGFKNWGGGAFCADNWQHPPSPRACFLPATYPNGTSYLAPNSCWVGPGVLCGDKTKTEVFLPFGAQQYIGLGFLVFVTIIILEIFGSPFMRNASVILALLFGYMIAACVSWEGKKYVITDKIDTAPVVTFLWTTTFPLGFYAPAVIPLCIVFIITSIETVGDTAATMEASRLPTDGKDGTRRIKGALLNDGISGIFSALATSLPLTTFAQNNGVIALTNVASRQAGFAAAFWLFLLGILGKVGAWITTIPESVLGGMTTFLFANVIASGIKIIINGDPLTRRSRFILACSLALAFGVELVPQWATLNLWPVTPDMNSAVRGIRDAIILVISTSFTCGAVTALILNLIIPKDAPSPIAAGDSHGKLKSMGSDASDCSDASVLPKLPALDAPPCAPPSASPSSPSSGGTPTPTAAQQPEGAVVLTVAQEPGANAMAR